MSEKRGKEEYAVLSYQFVSSVFRISDKFEARSLKILFSARIKAVRIPFDVKRCSENAAGMRRRVEPRDVLTVRFEIPFVTYKSVPFARGSRDITIIPTRTPIGVTVTVVNGGTSR